MLNFNYTLFTIISKLSSNVSETGKSWRDLVCIERHLNDPNPPWGRHNFEISFENERNMDLLSTCRISYIYSHVKILYFIWGCSFTYNEALYSVMVIYSSIKIVKWRVLYMRGRRQCIFKEQIINNWPRHSLSNLTSVKTAMPLKSRKIMMMTVKHPLRSQLNQTSQGHQTVIPRKTKKTNMTAVKLF